MKITTKDIIASTQARFERAPPKRIDFESIALDHSATAPFVVEFRGFVDNIKSKMLGMASDVEPIRG